MLDNLVDADFCMSVEIYRHALKATERSRLSLRPF